MLTGDENIVDIDFQVVWNINDPAKFLFNLRDAKAPPFGRYLNRRCVKSSRSRSWRRS